EGQFSVPFVGNEFHLELKADLADEAITNVAVVIRQHGPARPGDFTSSCRWSRAKSFFRVLLKHLGPHATLPSDSPLLRWKCGREACDAVYNYRLSCFAQTKTLASKDETFASCLNKAGYWVSLTSFLNTILMQAWPTVLRGAVATSAQFQPLIDEDAVKLAMEFFTYRPRKQKPPDGTLQLCCCYKAPAE
ncbi:Ammecr1l, partial [Symbiodinium necroappetens]